MQDIERQTQILNFLKLNHSATVNELSKSFYASPSTIRRDLTNLEKTGMIHRTHGGAIYNDRIKEVSIMVRRGENEEVKTHLAEITIKYIPDFNSIYIDNSSTCLSLIRKLNLNKKLVVTNSLLIVREVKAYFNANVIFLGGDYDMNNMSTSGPITAENINNFNFDLMIQSAAFVDKNGAYENEYQTALLKKIAREKSRYRILIFDKTKLEKNAPCKSSSLNNFDFIVTDLNNEEIETLRNGDDKLVFYNS